MKLCLISMLSLAAAGCVHSVNSSLDRTVLIDPAFTPDQIEAVTTGVEQWSAAVPALRLTTVVSACDGDQRICIAPRFDAPAQLDLVGSTDYVDSGANVWIYVTRIRDTGWNEAALTQQTAAHELGHALSGPEHLAAGTLMAATVQTQSPTITSADIAHFWAAR